MVTLIHVLLNINVFLQFFWSTLLWRWDLLSMVPDKHCLFWAVGRAVPPDRGASQSSAD